MMQFESRRYRQGCRHSQISETPSMASASLSLVQVAPTGDPHSPHLLHRLLRRASGRRLVFVSLLTRRTGLWAIDRSCDNTVAAVTQKRTASAQRSKNCALSFVRLPSVAPELAVGKDVLIFGRVPGDTGRDAAGDLIRRCIRIQTRVCDRGACRLIEGGGAQEDGTLEHGAGDEVVHDRNGGRST